MLHKKAFSLTYIYHDCFMLETSHAVMIFDYWKDPFGNLPQSENPRLLEEINPEKRVYIILSHHHKDHFNRKVFTWAKEFHHINFIISKDIFRAASFMLKSGGHYSGYRPPLTSIHVLSPGEIYEDDVLSVRAFPSTDIGNSYAVEICGLKIFHAGDLNAWLWLDESTEKEIETARNDFNRIIQQIQDVTSDFDVAMFPVDSRLGRQYWWGAKHFVDSFNVKLFVPMHFELGETVEEKLQRRIDAAAFNLFAREDYGAYLQLASSRSRYFSLSPLICY